MAGRLLAAAVLVCAALAAGASPAQAQWRQNGRDVPDEPWRASDGTFGAMLLLTAQAEDFLKQWNQPAAPDSEPSIKTVSEARRGDRIAAMVLFGGCAPDKTGSCSADVDFRVLRPDGSVYGEQKGAVLWRGPVPPGAELQLAQHRLVLRIEPHDPLGTYQIRATARDVVAGRSVSLVQKLNVVDGRPAGASAQPRE